MSMMQEAVLDRLWTRYENRFGHPPPITSASFDDAIAAIRRALDEPGRYQMPRPRHNDTNKPEGRPIPAPCRGSDG